MADILSKLPPHEREALATCGIINDSQLEQIDIQAVMTDLKMAQEAFPDARFSMTEARLREIHHLVDKTGDGTQTGATAATAATAQTATQGAPYDEADGANEEGETPRALPELTLRRHQHRKNRGEKAILNAMEAPGVANSVHCSRPITTYLSALFMAMFYGGLLVMAILPFLVFTGYMETDYIYHYAAAAVAALVPYVLVSMWCHCSVCKMKFFTLVPYNLNRHAHTIPFFGLTTLVTALHIILFRWYRCPACGTSIRLFRSRHGHH